MGAFAQRSPPITKTQPMPNQINPNKLPLSKWTAVAPQRKEKHFIVTRLLRDELENITGCVIEAVLTQRAEEIDWQVLQDDALWRQGWL